MAKPSEPNQTPKRRILVAEDDEALAKMLVKVLSQKYAVERAADGQQALAMAAKALPNLIILDVMMPYLDGFAVAQQLRAIPTLKSVPIVFLTARTDSRDVVRGIQAGARHYVTKPFKIDDLLSKVKKALGE